MEFLHIYCKLSLRGDESEFRGTAAEVKGRKKMSREDLAGEMNVSRQAVYKWENNKGYPDIENLIKLSEVYNVTLDELIKEINHFKAK